MGAAAENLTTLVTITHASSDLRTDFMHNGAYCLVGIDLAPSFGSCLQTAWAVLELLDKIITMWTVLS